jgi:hypothetical protein
MEQMNVTKELRTFGLLVGGIFLVIGLWPMVLRSEAPRLWALGLGGGLAGLGGVFPRTLKPAYTIWMKLGYILGWINTRIILGTIFFALITPMGLLMRLFGWDAMRRGFSPEALTYRVIRHPRPRTHMKNQF